MAFYKYFGNKLSAHQWYDPDDRELTRIVLLSILG